MGVVIVANEISIEDQGVTVSVNDNQEALRFEGGASINIVSKFSILITAGYDFVLGKRKRVAYYSSSFNNPRFKVIGGILNLTIGASYGF